jgi:hypothetical protein
MKYAIFFLLAGCGGSAFTAALPTEQAPPAPDAGAEFDSGGDLVVAAADADAAAMEAAVLEASSPDTSEPPEASMMDTAPPVCTTCYVGPNCAPPETVTMCGVGGINCISCDDGDPCTTDSCDASGACHHANVAAGTGCNGNSGVCSFDTPSECLFCGRAGSPCCAGETCTAPATCATNKNDYGAPGDCQ